jgi:hypothetical protein
MKKNENIVTGKTKSGIKFSIDRRVKDDVRLLYWLSKVQDENTDATTRNDALFALLELIFGSDGGLYTFMNEVASKHDGVADGESLIAELSDMFEVLQVKNS